MNTFITTVMINNLAADYHVFRIGKKYKAMLVEKHLENYIPTQLDFWKEKGQWRTYHPLTQQVIGQFGNYIDHYYDALEAEHLAAINGNTKVIEPAVSRVANS
jgi:hypothetical protein